MTSVAPRHVVCVLGNWRSLDGFEEIVERTTGADFNLDKEYSQLARDGRMEEAFEVSYDRVMPTMLEDDWKAVQEHSAVVYVMSPPMQKEKALDVSGKMLNLVAALLENGGVAAKSESAGIAHGRDKWLQLDQEYNDASKEKDDHRKAATLYSAWVRRPLLSREKQYYSCGMHLLGEYDVEIDSSIDVDEAIAWMDLLANYLLADTPRPPVLEGDGFRFQDKRRTMHLLQCTRYEVDDFFHNPYGYIRLMGAAGSK